MYNVTKYFISLIKLFEKLYFGKVLTIIKYFKNSMEFIYTVLYTKKF